MRERIGCDFKFVHRNAEGKVLYDSGWEPNQVSDDGYEHIFDVFFRNATAPASFAIGLTVSNPSRDDSYGDLSQVTNTDDGYELQTLARSAAGFPSLEISGGDMELQTAEVIFTNTNINIGNTDYKWDTATDAFLTAYTSEAHIFILWKALSVPRDLMPGDTLAVTIRQKGKIPTT